MVVYKVAIVEEDECVGECRIDLFWIGQIPDGLLFRVSSIDADAVHAFKAQQQFVADMMAAVPPEVRQRLSGLKPAGAT